MHGFRFVEVSGYPGTPALAAIEGRVVHDELPELQILGEFIGRLRGAAKAGRCLMRYKLVLFLSVCAALPAAAQSAGAIEGTVLDTSSKPLPGARVRAVRVRPTAWTSKPVASSAAGQFRITGLADGDYILCAAADPKLVLADPCFWHAPGVASASIAVAGRAVTGQTVRMLEGRWLRVRVADPEATLVVAEGVKQTRSLLVWLGGPVGSLLVFPPGARNEKNEQVYEALLPATPLPKLGVHAAGLRVTDEAQRELAPMSQRAPVTLAADREAVTEIVLNVTAR